MFPQNETQVAKARFGIAVCHLIAVAGLLHVSQNTSDFAVVGNWQLAFLIAAVCCSIAAGMLTPGHGFRRVRGALLPCLSLPPWDAEKSQIWLPGFGWRSIDEQFRLDVAKQFSVPMVVIALMVLPLFAAQHFLHDERLESPVVAGFLEAGSAAVWAAFAYEFIVCCSIAEKRFAYVKQHWLDAIIILLPLIAFLRAARLARLAKLQQTARVFRMRGMLMRMWKAVILFDLIERVLFAPLRSDLRTCKKNVPFSSKKSNGWTEKSPKSKAFARTFPDA